MSTNPNDKMIADLGGPFTTTDNMVAFVYELLRDHLPAGEVEKLRRNSISTPEDPVWVLSNRHIAQYAQYVVDSLRTNHE